MGSGNPLASEPPGRSRGRCPELSREPLALALLLLAGSPGRALGEGERGRGAAARAPGASGERREGVRGRPMKWVYSEKWVRGAWDPAAVRLSRSAPRGAREPPGAERDALGTLAGRGARFPSAPPALPQRSGAGMGRRHLRPFLSSKLFHTPTSAAARCVGGSGVLRILASSKAWRDRGGFGEGAPGQ